MNKDILMHLQYHYYEHPMRLYIPLSVAMVIETRSIIANIFWYSLFFEVSFSGSGISCTCVGGWSQSNSITLVCG